MPKQVLSRLSAFAFVVSRLYSLDYRFALIPNAGHGHAHASMGATLALRICRLFNAPINGFKSFADKVSVCLAEVLAAKESAVC
ncbi:hypothetical protein SAMN05720759_101323 [Fibrobacter sp. UWB12]|nr:hypothetical protein SAMN05720759_101323 [Fibrobacter sp. UWB12]